MKVAILFMHPFSESMGSYKRVIELAGGLTRVGVEIYILTPYEPSFDFSSKLHVVCISDFLTAMGLSKIIYKTTKAAYYSKAFLTLFSGVNSSTFIFQNTINKISNIVLNLGIDLLQVEQDAALPIGIALKKATGLPLIVDIHNISSEELVAAGVLSREGKKFERLQLLTRELLNQIDYTLVVSDSMKQYVIQNYDLPHSKISVVPPGGTKNLRHKYKSSKSSMRVVYAGLVSYREHVDLFIRSMPSVTKKAPNANFYITNKGDALAETKKMAKRLKVVPEYFWYDDYSMVERFLSTCNIGILPSTKDLARQMGTPVKLFSYLSAGLPVVANDIGYWSKLIKEHELGLLSSDNPEDFAENILRLIQNPELAAEYSKNCIEFVKNKYNWDNSVKILLNVYAQLSPKVLRIKDYG